MKWGRMVIHLLAGTGLALLGMACAAGTRTGVAEPVPLEVRGVVVDAATRQPVAGASVRLPAADAGGTTDAAGAFRIRGHGRPGRYVLTAARIGYAPQQKRVRIRPEGVVDVGTVRLRAQAIRLDDLVVPECLRHDRPPADTAPGATVREKVDSTGTFWLACRAPDP